MGKKRLNLKAVDRLIDLGVDGRLIENRSFKQWTGGMGLD
jgi:hypothetical protein